MRSARGGAGGILLKTRANTCRIGGKTPGRAAPARREARVRVTLDLQAAQSDWWARGRGWSRVETSSAVLERGGQASPGPCVGNPSHLPEVGALLEKASVLLIDRGRRRVIRSEPPWGAASIN